MNIKEKGDEMNKLTKYIYALTNLNGMIDKQLVMNIYNHLNDEKITLKDINVYFNRDEEKIPNTEVYTYGTYFMHEINYQFDHYLKFLQAKEYDFYYVPNEEQLLKYTDFFYLDNRETYDKLYDYVYRNIFDYDQERSEYFTYHVYRALKFELEIDALMAIEFERLDVKLADTWQTKIMRGLLEDLNVNVRKWLNNGFTDRELSAILNKSDSSEVDLSNVITFRRKKEAK